MRRVTYRYLSPTWFSSGADGRKTVLISFKNIYH